MYRDCFTFFDYVFSQTVFDIIVVNIGKKKRTYFVGLLSRPKNTASKKSYFVNYDSVDFLIKMKDVGSSKMFFAGQKTTPCQYSEDHNTNLIYIATMFYFHVNRT